MKKPKLNRFMKKWIDEAIKDYPEPFSAKQIHSHILGSRRNSQYIQSTVSVGYYLNNMCIQEKTSGGRNVYRRRRV